MGWRWPVTDSLRNAMQARIKEMGDGAQKLIAEKAGISEPTLSLLLSGRNKGSEFLPGVCGAMGLDMWEFMPLDDDQRRVLKALEEARKAGQGEQFTAEAESRAKWLEAHATGPVERPSSPPRPAPPRARSTSDE